MANSKLNLKVLKVEGTVTLEMTVEEAIVLAGVLRKIGGCPSTSYRKEVESIYNSKGMAKIDSIINDSKYCMSFVSENSMMLRKRDEEALAELSRRVAVDKG